MTDKNNRKAPSPPPLVIALEVAGATCTAALIDERARILAESRIDTPPRTLRAVPACADMMLKLALSPERGDAPINALGLCVQGHVDPTSERVTIPALDGWTRVALRAAIERELEKSGHDIRRATAEKHARAELHASPHPVFVTVSHAAAAAAAEVWQGAARGKRHVVLLAIDNDDLAAGVIADGRVLTGGDGYAGAAARLALSDVFKPEYESKGCVAFEACGAALTRRAVEEWSGAGESMLGQLAAADVTQLTPAVILRAARGGDRLALKIVGENCRWIGRAAANLISLLNPEVLVIGGEFGASLKPFLDEIRAEARRWAAAKQCRIVAASMGERAGLIGAARLAGLQAGA